MSKPEYLSLKGALGFYRKLSSRLRIYQDRPEHQIRLEPQTLDRLAKKIGVKEIDTGEKLLQKLKESRKQVHEVLLKYIGE